MQVKRTRTVSNVEYKHNLDFSIKSNTITFQTPKNVVNYFKMEVQ
jgi:hypothetical protein